MLETEIGALRAPARGPASRRPLIVALTAVAYFMVALDALVVFTALPSIHRSLGGSFSTLQWTANAYTLAFGAGIITAATIGDRLGSKRIYLYGLALFTAASAACALAPNMGALIACRAIQGVGAAVIMPLGLTLLTSAFPPERRGAVVGIWGGIAGIAVGAGPLIGGAVTQGLNWHWIFWVNVPIGVAALIGGRRRLDESHGPSTPLDLPALALVTAGIGSLIWALVQGPQDGWSKPHIVGAIVIGVVALVGFLFWEARAAHPMIPLGLFRRVSFSAGILAQGLLTASIISATFLLSEFFQFGRGYSPLATGLRFIPLTATPLFVVPVAGLLFDRIGARPLVVPGLLVAATGFGWIIHDVGTGSSYAAYIAPMIIAGVGVSAALPCIPAVTLNAAPPAQLAQAAGVLSTVQQLGGAFGIAIATAIFNARGSLASASSVTTGVHAALFASAGAAAFGGVIALAVRKSRQPAAMVSA